MGAEGLGEHFAGTTACLSALNAARRHEELLALVNGARLNWWEYRQYGVDALIALKHCVTRKRRGGLNARTSAIARKYEVILLSSSMMDEAYRRYAIEANQAATHLATFRAIAKKYPDRESRQHPPRSRRQQSRRGREMVRRRERRRPARSGGVACDARPHRPANPDAGRTRFRATQARIRDGLWHGSVALDGRRLRV
ncbi:hypothetical protein LMG29542_07903 [Paraburkholderia humisilvae]|uniref:Uncharacterized protein n=1 Tax=Paraburkholderia humisilvae TaxID=627669 RepID=A0A6J5FBB4_9BURK|nr:hypothetical protein LMG29542_07903 [Paraburkholderia humisilvae]